MAILSIKPITDNDLLRLSAEQPVELIHGELVPKMAAGVTHIYVIRNVFRVLDAFVLQNKLGDVFPDGLHYILKEDAEGIKESRLPDLSFLRKGRLRDLSDPNKPFHGAPDLAVEVVSPSEGKEVSLSKIRDYLAAGTEQVWVLYPALEEVHVHDTNTPKSIRIYSGEDILESPTLFPNLKIPIKQFFAMTLD